MTDQDRQTLRASRRGFLGGLVALGAGAATLAPSDSPATPARPAPESDAQGPDGYRETEHVRDYYRSARM